ncbi:hypothetical protein Micbo1qcDRAFT_208319 [Microdochium bolleyi]|uniref:Transferase family-domain-containing protein n=1 Tax=Microdochium bolleyi TaxID=196109 RepID=A0A136IQZ2_9PEZI|nr:hypothetical protein Micbo1qcDRAFT_208319 [Microdochium bolleyi]
MPPLSSVFCQIAPRCYVTIAHFFRTSVDQDSRAIEVHLKQAIRDLISIQPSLSGLLSEDEAGFIHLRPQPLPELHEINVKELDCRQTSFDDLEDKHYGPSYCIGPDFAMPLAGNDPAIRAALCWYKDGFAVVTLLHHTVADGLSCQYLIEALAATSCEQKDGFGHRQLRMGEVDRKEPTQAGLTTLSSGSTSTTGPSKEDQALFDEHCAYIADGYESGPLARKVTVVPPGPKTQLLLRAWTPHKATEDAYSCSRFCKRAAQAWILIMVARHRAGRLQQRPGTVHMPVPEPEPLAHLLFAVGLSRADDELGSRAIYSKTSFPASRLLRALDDPAEVRELEIHISKAIKAAHRPGFAHMHEQAFSDYFRNGGSPQGIRLCADEADPYAFFFNTWRFMGQSTRDRAAPIRWSFPGLPAPRAPNRVRKVAPVYGAASYCLVQPSTKTGRRDDDDEDSADEIVITVEGGEAREFIALVAAAEREHAGIASRWQVLDMITETA